MALTNSSGFSHVRLTVTDIERSRAFYDALFGWPVAIDASEQAGEPGIEDSPEKFYGGVVYQTPQGTLFGLRPVGDSVRFHPNGSGPRELLCAVAFGPRGRRRGTDRGGHRTR